MNYSEENSSFDIYSTHSLLRHTDQTANENKTTLPSKWHFNFISVVKVSDGL